MECFPAPRNALPELRAVVTQTIIPWDSESFESFLERQALAIPSAELSDDELISILQSWLFFGLLSYIYEGIVVEDYIISLPSHPEDRFLSLRPLSDSDRLSWLAGTPRAKESTITAAEVLAQLENEGRLSTSPVAETALAIYALLDCLRLQRNEHSGKDGISWQKGWKSAFLAQHMTMRGWCPQQVKYLFGRNGPIMMLYLARLPRTNPSKISHASCTDEKCIGNNVELGGGYRCRHVVADCQCATIYADAEAVKDIVRKGGVPLISIVGHSIKSMSLKVSTASYYSKYTAMSHVWADGLGNPQGNGLPACQLQRMSDYLSLIPSNESGGAGAAKPSLWTRRKSPLFWMDTLCIPVGAPDDQDVNALKARAINTMARIYAGGRQVLVLDAELQSHSILSDDVSQEEIMAWIVTTTWMRRCWTLHEGALGRQVLFQFKDGVMNCRPRERTERFWSGNIFSPAILNKIATRLTSLSFMSTSTVVAEAGLWQHPMKLRMRNVWRNTTYQTLELLGHGYTARDPYGRATEEGLFTLFCLVWNELIPRSTTKAEDLPTIFASLLDFKAHEILKVSTELRLFAMLANMPLIPQELLFNTGDRLRPAAKHKLRWVPTTSSTYPVVPITTPIVPKASPMAAGILGLLSSQGEGSKWFTNRTKKLRLNESGDLYTYDEEVIMLDDVPGDVLKSSFVLSLSVHSDEPEATEKRKHYRVEVERAADDEMDMAGVVKVALLLNSTCKRGCIVLLTEYDGTDETDELTVTMKGLYDCPVSLTAMENTLPTDSTETILGAKLIKASQLVIENDASDFAGKFQRRPYYRATAQSLSTILFFAPLAIALLSAIAAIVLRILLEVRHRYSLNSTIDMASLVLFGIESFGVVMSRLPFLWPPIAAILFAVDRQRDPGYYGTLELAYIITHIFGGYIVTVMFFSTTTQIVSFVFKGFYYMYWVRTFEQ